MAKRVNNIAYKGINHSPSLVSDNDGLASECANLSPDFKDLKPMPMPVKKSGSYHVTNGAKLVFVHRGVGYENYIELDGDGIRLYLRDQEGHYLYYSSPGSPDWPWWWNQSEILSVEAVGNTLVVSTKEGTEYIVYQPDVPAMGLSTGGSYKPIGQKPPMPVIEFRMHRESTDFYTAQETDIKDSQGDHVGTNQMAIPFGDTIYFNEDWPEWYDLLRDRTKSMIAKISSQAARESKFNQPFMVRFAYRTKTGDYIMQSPPVLMQPSTNKCSLLCNTLLAVEEDNLGNDVVAIIWMSMIAAFATLQYKIHNNIAIQDWSDIISSVDVFASTPILNYDTDAYTDASIHMEIGGRWRELPKVSDTDFGDLFTDGTITNFIDVLGSEIYNQFPLLLSGHCYKIKSVEDHVFNKQVTETNLFHKVASLDLSELENMDNYEDLPIDNLANLANLANLPTLEDDYNSQCSVSAKLMQNYNSRLNMANISQKVFGGFVNGMQPQSTLGWYDDSVRIYQAYYVVKKNGKTYTVTYMNGTAAEKIDYTTYLYYPDPDCYEAVLRLTIRNGGSMSSVIRYITIPMKRHEYLNGSYWYDDMKCLGEYVYDRLLEVSDTAPTLSTDLWYDIPNRFMMSATGNPWHFPLQETFDIGLREIRALSVNTENMDAPQYGQNPIYVFSTDGVWTIGINKDGTHNGISYVSGDVISEAQGIGSSPTASAPQTVFFKTSRGIMAATGSKVQSIDLVMRGRVFNPRTRLLPAGSIIDGVPTAGINSYWLDLIFNVCDDLPYADFAKDSNLIYDYRNNRLLLHNGKKQYMYVYDVAANFWGKMLPMVVDESPTSPAIQEFNTRGRSTVSYTIFNATVTAGSDAILTDNEGHLWYVGGQPDENDITATQFGLYVSRPMRFGTDDYKTLSRVVHDYQTTYLENSYQNDRHEYIRMGLWGSRDGRKYWQINTLRGTSYKFFIIVLYTRMLPSSRYAYTAFEWEARMTDKIR